MEKIVKSMKNINYRLFTALLILGLVPTIYTTVRIFFIGQLPGDWSFSIAGQLSWVNLIFEIVNEAIILPLYFFIGMVVDNKVELSNRVKSGLLVTFCIYLILAISMIVFIDPLLDWMAVDSSIKSESSEYIRIEVIASIFTTLVSFGLVVLTTIRKEKYLYIFVAAKLILCLILDTFLVSTMDFSANLGVNGIGYSNMISGIVLFVCILVVLEKEGISVISKDKLTFAWMKDFAKIGGVSGLESFVRNAAYLTMIVTMVNVVNEQGTYWVANNFIWGWLLLPIIQLGELIKRDAAADDNAVKNNTLGYFAITAIVCVIWIITIPIWKPFMADVLELSDVDKIFSLVMLLLGFYVMYAFQNVFDSTFYGLGKTHYMLFESIVTNSIYYGTAYVLYLQGIWSPSLEGIALLFGIGVAFDSIVSLVAYAYLLKRCHINIFDVESKTPTRG